MSIERAEILKQQEVFVDDDGIDRPVHTFSGHKVIFRTRQETPSFHSKEGFSYHIVSSADAAPLPMERAEAAVQDFSRFAAEADSKTDPDVNIITATPEGILGAVIELSDTEDPELVELQVSLRNREYSPKAIQYIDTIIAALNFDDTGKREQMDTEGYGLVMDALAGNDEARGALSRRMDVMYAFFDTEAERRSAALDTAESAERLEGFEAIDPSEVVLVRSTGHAIERDENGLVVLKTAPAYRDDRFPRSTLHFTANGQVASHYAGVWGSENALIVANFADVVSGNEGKVPTAMQVVDTYFSLNPGEKLKLPGAIIVSGASGEQQTELISRKGDSVTYKHADEYSESDLAEIASLAEAQGLSGQFKRDDAARVLREISLRVAMGAKGAKQSLKMSAHASDAPEFERRYEKLAGELHATIEVHAYADEGHMEDAAYIALEGEYSRRVRPDRPVPQATFYNGATIQSIRQIVASGYIPARPYAAPSQSSWSSGGVFN